MENKKIQVADKGQESTNSANIGPLIFLSIFAILLAVATGLSLRQLIKSKTEAEIAIHQLVQDKHEFANQLDILEEEFIKLSLENEDLENNLRRERARIRRLRAELSGLDAEEAQRFKDEIQQLELQLEAYRSEVRGLEAEKQSLSREKSQMQTTLDQTQSRFSELERTNKELEEKVEKASLLTISGLNAQGIREKRRGDEITDRARRTDKIQICFTINENLVANPGNREFYIRIINPENRMLSHTPGNTFRHDGEQIGYSLRRQVNFRNNEQEVCDIWVQDERFERGYYNIAVYSEGRESGYVLIELD